MIPPVLSRICMGMLPTDIRPVDYLQWMPDMLGLQTCGSMECKNEA